MVLLHYSQLCGSDKVEDREILSRIQNSINHSWYQLRQGLRENLELQKKISTNHLQKYQFIYFFTISSKMIFVISNGSPIKYSFPSCLSYFQEQNYSMSFLLHYDQSIYF